MKNLFEKIIQNPHFEEQDKKLIEKAYVVAEKAHEGQKRQSGDPYITHPVHTAYFLSELGLDATTVAAALLHDTLEDTSITSDDLVKGFGKEIAFLVQGVTKLGNIKYSSKKARRGTMRQYANSLKKMFIAMAEDIRVILIRLADRYHNMETLKYLPVHKQKRIANETLEIYAPIAGRLAMGRLKGQLEDLAFPYVNPKRYAWLMNNVRDKYRDRMNYIEKTKPMIKRHLTDAGINVVDLNSRAKHHYSLYNKLRRKGMNPDKVFDLVAMRVILPDIKSCYEALGVLHKYYKPLPGRIKDYIALPKPNGYQSLHTTIFCEKGRVVEIQIRTEDMHEHAENGIAAYWAYSEGGKNMAVNANLKETRWVSQLKDVLTNVQPKESLTNLKIDFFKDRIFAFTPNGDVKDLPEGSTPIDFAYSIHTDIGHSMKGAKVNGKMVSFEYNIQNGDVVDILKGKKLKPSFDWIQIAKYTETKRRIRAWFTAEERKEKELKDKRTKKKKK
jgi:GTP diphosphokinase / guanosine-3',5'-bis(diphosphate) 3'-diphosphatase